MTALSLIHRSKENLAYASARRDVPALVSAAEAHFGRWGKALYVTGIDPNLYFVHGATGEGAIKVKRPRISGGKLYVAQVLF